MNRYPTTLSEGAARVLHDGRQLLARLGRPLPSVAPPPARAANQPLPPPVRRPRQFVTSSPALALRTLGVLPPPPADPIGALAKLEGVPDAAAPASSVTTVEEPATRAELIAAAPTGADGVPPNAQVSALWWLKAHVDATVDPAKPTAEALKAAAELVRRIDEREAQAAAPKLRAAVARRLGGWYGDAASSPEEGLQFTRSCLNLPAATTAEDVLAQIARVVGWANAPGTVPPGVDLDGVVRDLRKIWGVPITATADEILNQARQAAAAIAAGPVAARAPRTLASKPSGAALRLSDLPGRSQFERAQLFLTRVDPGGFGRLSVARQVAVFKAELAKRGIAL